MGFPARGPKAVLGFEMTSMVLPSPKAWHSTSLSTIAAMADNRNSQLPSIWHQRMTGLPLLSAVLAITSPNHLPSSVWRRLRA